MENILTVQRDVKDGKTGMYVSYPEDHPQAEEIDRLLNEVGPGYVEFWLQNGNSPTCFSCKSPECQHVGSEREACKIYRYSEDW